MIGFLFALAVHFKSCKIEGCVNLRYVQVVYNADISAYASLRVKQYTATTVKYNSKRSGLLYARKISRDENFANFNIHQSCERIISSFLLPQKFPAYSTLWHIVLWSKTADDQMGKYSAWTISPVYSSINCQESWSSWWASGLGASDCSIRLSQSLLQDINQKVEGHGPCLHYLPAWMRNRISWNRMKITHLSTYMKMNKTAITRFFQRLFFPWLNLYS